MAAAYSDAVRQRCRDPRRAGSWPEGTAGIGSGATGSLDAGAWTRLQVRVAADGATIDDARFRVFGCSAAVASASFVADALVGVSLRTARGLEARQVIEALALPDDKQSMAVLATDAARAAVDDWETRTGARGSGPGAQSTDAVIVPGLGGRR